jgi:hypothetical protein
MVSGDPHRTSSPSPLICVAFALRIFHLCVCVIKLTLSVLHYCSLSLTQVIYQVSTKDRPAFDGTMIHASWSPTIPEQRFHNPQGQQDLSHSYLLSLYSSHISLFPFPPLQCETFFLMIYTAEILGSISHVILGTYTTYVWIVLSSSWFHFRSPSKRVYLDHAQSATFQDARVKWSCHVHSLHSIDKRARDVSCTVTPRNRFQPIPWQDVVWSI